MIFPYGTVISVGSEGDFLLLYRPEIPITIVGPSGSGTYFGLVDTGSDDTILPKSIADYLGIAVEKAAGPPAHVFGGYRLELLCGELTFRLEADGESVPGRLPHPFSISRTKKKRR